MKKLMMMMLLTLSFIAVGCSAPVTEPVSDDNEATQVAEEEELAYTFVNEDEVKSALANDKAIVVDARPIAAFNGWTLANESRGGHIQGAVAFDAKWMTAFETDEALMAELNLFGISKEKEVLVYGYDEDAKQLAVALTEKGYESVSLYEGGIVEWAANIENPMAKMTHHEYLVSANWVNDLMAGKEVEGYDGRDYIVIEASWGPGDKYAEGHIPDAIHINTDDYEVGPLWNRVSDDEILASTLKNGITKDTMVVLYGSDTTPAARVAIMLKYLGVEDVRLLDGGYQAWTAAGYDTATGMVEVAAAESFGLDLTPAHPEYIVDMPEAEALLADENGRLVSIRSWVEFTGETSGYDYIDLAGRIDGATYGFGGSDPWHMEDFRNVDNTAVNYEYMTKRWADNGLTDSNQSAFYCGTGWRAAETWFYAHAMGWEQTALYDGGWKEWSEAGKPYLVGDPTK